MNELSWLIYLAGVVGGFQFMFAIVAFGAAGTFILTLLVNTFAIIEGEDGLYKTWRAVRGLSIITFFVSGAIANLLPARDTVLLVASSQFGEQVIKTPEAREIFTELKARIMRELHSDEAGK